jgi:hypothetical protein
MLATILTYTWLLEPRLPRRFVMVPAAVVAALGLWRAVRTGRWGFALGALGPALRASALFTVPAVAALLAAGTALGSLRMPEPPGVSLAWLLAWGGAQQWLLQTVVLEEARRVVSTRRAVALAAGLFAAVHLPNPFLTAVTFAGALGWCAIYGRHPNVLPLAASHALATLAILNAFDPAMTGGLRIGAAYLRFEP